MTDACSESQRTRCFTGCSKASCALAQLATTFTCYSPDASKKHLQDACKIYGAVIKWHPRCLCIWLYWQTCMKQKANTSLQYILIYESSQVTFAESPSGPQHEVFWEMMPPAYHSGGFQHACSGLQVGEGGDSAGRSCSSHVQLGQDSAIHWQSQWPVLHLARSAMHTQSSFSLNFSTMGFKVVSPHTYGRKQGSAIGQTA